MKLVKSTKSASRAALLTGRVQSTGPATLAAHPAGAHLPLPPAQRVGAPGQSTAPRRTGGAAKGAIIAFPVPPPPAGSRPAHIRPQANVAAGLAPVIPFPKPTPRAARTVDQPAAGHAGPAAPAPRNQRGAAVAPTAGVTVARRGGHPGARGHDRAGVTREPVTVRPVLRTPGVPPRALHPQRAPVVGNLLPKLAPWAGPARGGPSPAAPGSGPGLCLPPAGLNVRQWLKKCAAHGNCLAFVPRRNNTPAVLKFVWARATAWLMPSARLHCDPVGGRHGGTAGMLVAFGQGHAQWLAQWKLDGVFFRAVPHRPALVRWLRCPPPKVPCPPVARPAR